MTTGNPERLTEKKRALLFSGCLLMVIWLACGRDRQAPQVQITSPTDGSQVGGVVHVLVGASDNRGVTRVGLYIDSSLVSTLTTPP